MMTTTERLEQMLNDKDAEIEDLRHKLYDAENQLKRDWPRHRAYKADDAPNERSDG